MLTSQDLIKSFKEDKKMSRGLRRKTNMSKNKLNIKKILDNIHWIDQIDENILPSQFEVAPEYPNDFRALFGTTSVYYLYMDNLCMYRKNYKKLLEFLMCNGFTSYSQGRGTYTFVNPERKICMSGDFGDTPPVLEDLMKLDVNGEPEEPVGPDDGARVHFYNHINNKDFVETLLKLLNTLLVEPIRVSTNFYMIAQNQNGLFNHQTRFKSIPIKDDRYDLFYGAEFPHEKLKKFITGETKNLMLLHGDPGTGKSNYIKHIITNSPRKVIYVPPSMLSVLATPGFVSYIMENQNSILLIEDAEEVLSIDRNSATNNLLGLTDGFLKDALNLKIICTFNCDIGQIDPALLRKGRMYFEYKFSDLSIVDGQKLSDFMELGVDVTEEMTLADLFNRDANITESSLDTKFMGFAT